MADTYKLIASQTLSSAAASITINSLPSTYKDLEIRVSARSSRAFDYDAYFLTLNGDSSTNYSYQSFYSQGSSSGADNSGANYTKILAGYATGASGTANTFSSNQILITNYAGSLHKAIKISSVEEYNSAAANYITTIASRYGSTSAITSLTLTMDGGRNFVAGSSIYIYGISAVGASEASTPTAKATGGDTVTTDGTYWYHKFTSSGTFTPSQSLNVDYLVVAGGGGGGNSNGNRAGGGGGAGGFLTGSSLAVTAQAYTVTVGSGGAANTNGSNSVFSSITSTGGGGGGYQSQECGGSAGTGLAGGSGGGGSSPARAGGTGTAGQGNNGGSGVAYSGNTGAGGGGGGASANGSNASGDGLAGGNGGSGTSSSISGSSVTYAGGGGGGSYASGYSRSSGGSGGGGNGGGSSGNTTGGTANTGGGGGGGTAGAAGSGGAGGSGIVIVRYPI